MRLRLRRAKFGRSESSREDGSGRGGGGRRGGGRGDSIRKPMIVRHLKDEYVMAHMLLEFLQRVFEVFIDDLLPTHSTHPTPFSHLNSRVEVHFAGGRFLEGKKTKIAKRFCDSTTQFQHMDAANDVHVCEIGRKGDRR